MEKKYYNAKEVAEITGFSRNKSYDIIKKLNIELQNEQLNKPENERTLIFEGKVNKEYFDKRIQI